MLSRYDWNFQLNDLQSQLASVQEQNSALQAEFERQINEKNAQIDQLTSHSADLQQRLEAMTVAMEEAERLRVCFHLFFWLLWNR